MSMDMLVFEAIASVGCTLDFGSTLLADILKACCLTCRTQYRRTTNMPSETMTGN